MLARLVSSVREEAAQRAYRSLAQAAAGADVELPLRLRDLLEVPEGKKVSELERLRTASGIDSGLAMSKALARVSEVLATDTASYSDIVFGLFRLLVYRFSPRIADVGGTGFWRADVG